MTSGPRNGRPAGLLGLITRALPHDLDTFVLPGLDIARANGLDIEAAGLRPAATPRHATVLLIVGGLPSTLLNSAAVVYAQMPRPRTLVALGAGDVSPLPAPDTVAPLTRQGLYGAVAQTRELLRVGAWSHTAQPFEAEVLLPKRRKRKKRKPSGDGKEAGERSQADGRETHDGAKGHGGMDHGGGMEMGFMSMVRLTQHLPRSADGLAMERVQAPFGPFFAGLPSGLELTLWLDGDSVARVEVPDWEAAAVEPDLAGDAIALPERLAKVDRLATASYRRLGQLALDSGREERPGGAARRLLEIEIERVASHLNWLAAFGNLLGYTWLSQHASEWTMTLLGHAEAVTVAALEAKLIRFLERVRRTPLLATRLRGIGRLFPDQLEAVSGPVARAGGLELDVRLHDPLYTSCGFKPVLRTEGDALARLLVRLEEVRASLALIRAAGRLASGTPLETPIASPIAAPTTQETTAEASVETPRGTASLRFERDGTAVTQVKLTTPSRATVQLIEKVAVGLELADALVAVASLDISPWEAYRWR